MLTILFKDLSVCDLFVPKIIFFFNSQMVIR